MENLSILQLALSRMKGLNEQVINVFSSRASAASWNERGIRQSFNGLKGARSSGIFQRRALGDLSRLTGAFLGSVS